MGDPVRYELHVCGSPLNPSSCPRAGVASGSRSPASRAPRSNSASGWPSSWAPPSDSPTGNRPAAWAPHGPPCRCGENASSRPGWRACCGTRPDRAATSRSAKPPWPRSCVCAWRSGPGRPPTGARARWPSAAGSATGPCTASERLTAGSATGGTLPAPHRPQVRGPGARHRGVGR
jgi:hypothetical protein